MIKKHFHRAGAGLIGLKIDLAWVEIGVPLSRKKIRKIIDNGGAFCNNKRVKFASLKVQEGDDLILQYDHSLFERHQDQQISMTEADILFEDSFLLAINKPPLLVSQATKNPNVIHVEAALKELLDRRPESALTQHVAEPRICHRLDKETSGVLLLGKSSMAINYIMGQFKAKEVSKIYHAICIGVYPRGTEWTVENYLSGIHRKTGMVESVRAGGKWASTSFRTLWANKDSSLSVVECRPITGRSHQIRVHLLSAGIPILGDKKYGIGLVKHLPNISSLASRHHMLHAKEIEISPKPGKASVIIQAPYPTNFKKIRQLAR